VFARLKSWKVSLYICLMFSSLSLRAFYSSPAARWTLIKAKEVSSKLNLKPTDPLLPAIPEKPLLTLTFRSYLKLSFNSSFANIMIKQPTISFYVTTIYLIPNLFLLRQFEMIVYQISARGLSFPWMTFLVLSSTISYKPTTTISGIVYWVRLPGSGKSKLLISKSRSGTFPAQFQVNTAKFKSFYYVNIALFRCNSFSRWAEIA